MPDLEDFVRHFPFQTCIKCGPARMLHAGGKRVSNVGDRVMMVGIVMTV